MLPQLFYCNTIFEAKPPSDVNPLILQRYHGKRILVLCCREGQLIRLRARESDGETFLFPCPWWDTQEMGLVSDEGYLNTQELLNWDVIVILCRERIQDLYLPLLRSIEGVFGRLHQIE